MINFSYSELEFLFNTLSKSEEDDTAKILCDRIEGELSDRWKSLKSLPPMGFPLVVSNGIAAKDFLAIRDELAESYSPNSLVLKKCSDGEKITLNTRLYMWRLAEKEDY